MTAGMCDLVRHGDRGCAFPWQSWNRTLGVLLEFSFEERHVSSSPCISGTGPGTEQKGDATMENKDVAPVCAELDVFVRPPSPPLSDAQTFRLQPATGVTLMTRIKAQVGTTVAHHLKGIQGSGSQPVPLAQWLMHSPGYCSGYWFPGAVVIKWHQIGDRKTTEIYCLTVLEGRSPNRGVAGPSSLSKCSRGASFLASSSFSWVLAIPGVS